MKEQGYLTALRWEFNQHLELGLHELRTASRIEEELDCFGISHTHVGETGVLGVFKGEKYTSSIVALLAIVTHRTSPVEPVVIGVGKLTAGMTYTAVAEFTVLEGTTRTVSQE